MIATINTDASFCPQNKIGTYAYWIRCGNGKWIRSGKLGGTVRTPQEAEIKCIIKALTFFRKIAAFDCLSFIINTDCAAALGIINKRQVSPKYLNLYSDLMRVMPPKIQARHVKAHKRIVDTRTFVNHWCDRQAKLQLQEYRISLTK